MFTCTLLLSGLPLICNGDHTVDHTVDQNHFPWAWCKMFYSHNKEKWQLANNCMNNIKAVWCQSTWRSVVGARGRRSNWFVTHGDVSSELPVRRATSFGPVNPGLIQLYWWWWAPRSWCKDNKHTPLKITQNQIYIPDTMYNIKQSKKVDQYLTAMVNYSSQILLIKAFAHCHCSCL